MPATRGPVARRAAAAAAIRRSGRSRSCCSSPRSWPARGSWRSPRRRRPIVAYVAEHDTLLRQDIVRSLVADRVRAEIDLAKDTRADSRPFVIARGETAGQIAQASRGGGRRPLRAGVRVRPLRDRARERPAVRHVHGLAGAHAAQHRQALRKGTGRADRPAHHRRLAPHRGRDRREQGVPLDHEGGVHGGGGGRRAEEHRAGRHGAEGAARGLPLPRHVLHASGHDRAADRRRAARHVRAQGRRDAPQPRRPSGRSRSTTS